MGFQSSVAQFGVLCLVGVLSSVIVLHTAFLGSGTVWQQSNATTTTTTTTARAEGLVNKPAFEVTTPLFRESFKDPWKNELYARLNRIRKACGELCTLNDQESIQAHTVKSTPDEKISFPRLVVPDVNCAAIIGCEEIDASDYTFPRSLPGELFPYYTLGGMTNFTRFRRFRRNYQGGDMTNTPTWTLEDLDHETKMVMLDVPRMKGGYGYGAQAVVHVREKLRQLQITNKTVLVIGSESPWVEAICLGLGAAHVTTLEYGRINCTHPKVETLTPSDFRQQYQSGTLGEFDVVVSHSSLEHSGLGRYGDALNPWGDILAVARAWCVTKPGGSMYLGLPTGLDDIYFNAHRVYGKVRWPLMAINWRQIDGDAHTEDEFLVPQTLDVPNGGTGFLFTKT